MLRDYKNFVEMRGDDEEKPTEPVDRKSPPVRRKRHYCVILHQWFLKWMKSLRENLLKINPEQPKRIWEELKALRDSLDRCH